MMMSPSNCALIISTYNWPNALEVCLLSVLRQSTLPNEVIIADDGSGIETKQLIHKYKQGFPVNLVHIWQEDLGFRLATIRNKAIAQTSTEYIIQIDGDIILHPSFIEDHLHFAQENCLLQGSRVMLGKQISRETLRSLNPKISILNRDIKRRENGIRILPLSRYLLKRYRNRYPVYYARGANMSFWRKDVLAINGYDEGFEGWGHEDSDLTLRFLNKQGSKMVLKFSAIAYHLHHQESNSKEKEEKNKALLGKTVVSKGTWAANGIDKYLTQNESE